MEIELLERINIVATSGSGKTTFAKKLSEILDIPHYEMDSLYWKDNWECETEESFLQKIEEVTQQSQWILDGNYSRTQPVKWQQVQTIIWLDYPFWLIFFRVVKRSVLRLFDRQALWNTNNRESFRRSFLSKESIIHWMITSYHRMKERYQKLFEKNSKGWQLIRLTSPNQAENFLNELSILMKKK